MRAFFVAILFCFSSLAFAEPKSSFFEQAKLLTEQATHKRQGIVIWTSLSDQQQTIFGNEKWAQEKFLPGSIFKLITAQAFLENGTSFQYHCSGKDKLAGKVRYCWTYRGHGSLDLPQALALSCNLYFQNLGLKLGMESLMEVMKQYPGLLSSYVIFTTDLARFSIGDDPHFRLSPQQVSEFWKQYVLKIQDSRYQAIFQGLRRSVQRGGTASKLKSSPLEILAKTGTGDALNPNYKTNAWFLGAYPAKNPQYTLLILLQEAHGFEEASALAQKIFSKLLTE